jgi:hypothetical protein
MKRYNISRWTIAPSNSVDDVIKANKAYTTLASSIVQVHSLSYYEKAMNAMKPETYKRKTLKSPSKDDVTAETMDVLRQIATCKFFSLSKDRELEMEDYVMFNLNQAVATKQSALDEVEAFYNLLEDDVEGVENEKLYKAYEDRRKKAQACIEGDTDFVYSYFDSVFSPYSGKINIPFSCDVKVDYDKAQKSVFTEIIIPGKLGVPSKKVVRSTSGRVSIQNKLVREQDIDTSLTIIGLAYYMASRLFNASPNIEVVDLSMVREDVPYGYLWIKFRRNKFSGLNPSLINPLTGIFDWDYVCNIKLVRGGTRIDPMAMDAFKKMVDDHRKNDTYSEQWDSPIQYKDYEGEEDFLSKDKSPISGSRQEFVDKLFAESARLIVSSQNASTSLIQRKLLIGYNRAGHIMDQMEHAGIVGPSQGSKPRELICKTTNDLEKILDKIAENNIITY